MIEVDSITKQNIDMCLNACIVHICKSLKQFDFVIFRIYFRLKYFLSLWLWGKISSSSPVPLSLYLNQNWHKTSFGEVGSSLFK